MKIAKSGALVVYKGKPAIISDGSGEKFVLHIAGGDSRSVRRKDFFVLHPGPCQTFPTALPEMPSADAQAEVAELMEGAPMEFGEFTELLFGKYTVETALRAYELVAEDCQFCGSPEDTVQANPAEKVRKMREKEEAKAQQQLAREALLERIRSGNIVPEDASSLREIENVAWNASESSKLMHDLGMEALPEKAQELLLKLKHWNYFDHNPWPRRMETALDPEYPEFPEADAAEERMDLTGMAAYAIDDAESSDPDDAIGFDAASGLLWVHVADPGSVVSLDGDLERFAMEQGSTLYLPEKIVPMLPPRAVPMLGLGLHETSPALSFGIRVDDDGVPHLEKLLLSTVKVTRLDYESAEPLMAEEPLHTISVLLERFRKRRAENGAVMIRLPEVKIKTDLASRAITVKPLTQNPVREMVANAMLCAGAAVAAFAVERDFAMPFAVQPEPEMTERPETLPGMYELRKSCRQSELSTVPGKHAGLGLEPYTRVTSPLRRYEDLLGHLQLRRFLKNEPLLSASEMDERLAVASMAAIQHTKLEKQCNEYWILVYLNAHPEWEADAVLVSKPDERSIWLIPELAYEFKNRYGGRTQLGETVRVTCLGADPALLTSQFRILPKVAAPGTTVNPEA